MTFSLRALVGEVLDTSPAVDPGALAEEVFDRIPAEHMPDAVREMLRGYVRQRVSESRMVAQPRPVEGKAARSWKVEAIREHWRKRLRERVHVGTDATAWKLLANCEYDDLVFAADERRMAAARTLAKATEYESLAKLLKDHGAATVGDLPEQVLSSHLAVAA